MPFLDYIPDEHAVQTFPNAVSNDFEQLIQELSDVLGPSSGIDSTDVNPQEIINLMKQYTSNEKHWQSYAFADSSRNYTRNLVDEGNGKSNLLILVWNPGKGSAIHDHADAHCVMKILQGKLQETIYSNPDQQDTSADPSPGYHSTDQPTNFPVAKRSKTYHRNQVTYISDEIGLHKITNPTSQVAVSLHLYTPPHAATFGFNMFDERTGRATHCKQAGFFSNRGKLVRVGLNGSM